LLLLLLLLLVMSAAESASALEAPGSSSRSVPAEHLDYSFIQSCSDLKHLEQILRVLRSGQDGFYPHLVEFCEKHIEKLDPKSRVLRKEHQAATAASFSTEEWRTISEDLQVKHLQNRVSAAVKTAKTSRVPRPYRDWDRCVLNVSSSCALLSSGLTAQEKDVLARREKDKGNGAFRSGDYEEAVVYYSRSLSLAPSVAALNNRAQAHIRLQHWSTALSDCDAVLQLEPGNVKALLRRATAHKHLGHQQHSHADLRAVLLIEPHNATALRDTHTTTLNTQQQVHTHTHRKHNVHYKTNRCFCCRGFPEFELLKHDGNALVRSGCYQEAVDRYTGCLQLKPHECAVYTNRALCYIKLQRFTEARHDCDSALQLQPTNKKAFYRRALANKGLKDYAACRSDLQQVLCLDASVTEVEQLLMEVTQLMTHSRGSSGTRRTITITEVDDDDDEDDEDEGSVAVVSSVSLRSCDVFEFGQVLGSAVSGGDLLTCAELLRSVAPERLPRLISTQLDGHTLGFIIRALNTHLLHTHPELVFLHLQQLHTAHRLTVSKPHANNTLTYVQDEQTNLSLWTVG
uniref:Sperm associated antigen 1b n=1 Tax=Cyprinus carpio TaxID=7962 RepID=A0A8C1N0U3_CYPCA